MSDSKLDNEPVAWTRREVARRALRKITHPNELAGLLRYWLREGNEYPWFDLVDFLPRLGTLFQKIGPDRLEFDRPIFLAGLRRSGTTLFYRTLNAHSGLTLYNERIPGIRMNGRGVATWQNIWSVENPDEFREISRRYLSPWIRARSGRWGVKLCLELAHPDPGSVPEHGFWRFFEAWPEARMLAIVRDPRDFVLSAMQRGGHDVEFWAAEYSAAASLFVEAAERYPERISRVRYEDLLSDPEATLQHCCSFAGLAYEPAMLDPGNWSIKGPKEYERGGIVKKPARREAIQGEDLETIARIEELCFPAAETVGYQR